ncbi:TerD family protein [Clostridium massiliamazoniense]|uniref:TerD family protein n=1 Tax=Clostridium massiliamazoniense TaxID=1347366 RepID=UPI0006D7DC02|nr:TerD family protein [Clostridium massiliamazoniense]
MAINLGGNFGNLGSNLGNSRNNTNNISNGGITLNLQKNDILDLTKRNPGLKKVVVGAGWDIATGGADFDVDIAAFLLDVNNRFNTVSNVIFFNNKQGQGIVLGADNRTGAGDGDDERINIDLSQIDMSIQKIVFVVTIHNAKEKRQTFGMINNSYVRLMDELQGEKELCRFNLKENGSTATSVIFAELYREGMEWQFKAIGEGKIGDLNDILALYQ